MAVTCVLRAHIFLLSVGVTSVRVQDRLTFIPVLTGAFSWVNIGGFTVHDITRIYYTRGFVSATLSYLP